MVLRHNIFKRCLFITEAHNAKENKQSMSPETNDMAKPLNQRMLTLPINKEQISRRKLCVVGLEMVIKINQAEINDVTVTKAGRGISAAKGLGQRIYFWLAGELDGCLKETVSQR